MTSPSSLAEVEIRDSTIPRYELLEWRQRFGLVAGITAKAQGLDFRLEPEVEPQSQEPGNKNKWIALARALEGRFHWVLVGRQEHTAEVAIHHQLDRPWTVVPRTDGHVTKLKGALLLATVADCVPVYLAHPASSTIALLHAGWRGIAAGILEAGFEHCLKLAAAPAEEWVMHCGISICGQCYEVGPEVREALKVERAVGRNVDLRGILARKAWQLGVGEVTVSTWCTAHHGERFYSHRAQGGQAGRMVAYLGLPDTGALA
jgi:YfiH family protein